MKWQLFNVPFSLSIFNFDNSFQKNIFICGYIKIIKHSHGQYIFKMLFSNACYESPTLDQVLHNLLYHPCHQHSDEEGKQWQIINVFTIRHLNGKGIVFL